MKTASRPQGLLLLGCAAILLATCSDDGTTPVATASMSAAVTDGAPVQAVAGVAAEGGGPRPVASLSGDMTGTAQIYAYSDVEGWVQLSPPQTVTLGLQSGSLATLAADTSVPAGTYTRVRLVLTDFHADVALGSIIDGVTLSTGVSIVMGGSDHVVQLEADLSPVTVSAGTGATVVVDLHSGTWVTQEAASAEVADDAAIQAAVTASVQTS